MNLLPKQREDLARAAIHDGLILSWATGCGKTIAALLWPLLKVGSATVPVAVSRVSRDTPRLCPAYPVLIVGPTDGFEHFHDEAEKLGLPLIALDSQDTFLTLTNGLKRPLAPAYYYTTYTQLTRNGVESFPDFEEWCSVEPAARLHADPDAQRAAYNILAENIGVTRKYKVESARDDDGNLLRYADGTFRSCARRSIRCIYSPSLADLISLSPSSPSPLNGERTGVRGENTSFIDCVVVDEGVHMKGAATQVGTGIRQLTPRYRLVLTATPIKNRLPDVFFLAAWAAGVDDDPNARWPYRNDPGEQTQFAENFLITERNLTKEAQHEAATRQRRRFKKLSAEICNVHGLWKLFAPIILRRRKQDFVSGSATVPVAALGVPPSALSGAIPQKNFHTLRVPMGTAQSEVYAYHLQARYLDKNKKPAHGAKLQALRVAAANPCSTLLKEVNLDSV